MGKITTNDLVKIVPTRTFKPDVKHLNIVWDVVSVSNNYWHEDLQDCVIEYDSPDTGHMRWTLSSSALKVVGTKV